MLTQKYLSQDRLFSLSYPRVWDMEIYEGVPAFFDPMSGSGALQVFAVDTDTLQKNDEHRETLLAAHPWLSGEKLSDKMLIFLHIQGVKTDVKNLGVYSDRGVDFIPFEYSVQGRFYMSVMMGKGNVVLLAIYNSATQPDKVEAGIIGNIIKSIEITDKDITNKVR